MSDRGRSTEQLIADLRESEERFRTICENAPVMIDQFDEQGRCKLWNRECEKQLGYTAQEVADCDDPLALFYPDLGQRNNVLDAISRADGMFREYNVRAKDGNTRVQMWADFRLPTGAHISVGHDVTTQRQVEAQLRQSQKMDALGHLTGGMAHDFNNLLTIVLANADVIERAETVSPPTRRAAREIISAAQRGAELIRKLLAFGRRERVALTVTDANALLNDVAPTLTRLLPESIRVTVHTEPSLPRIDVDPGAVEQMLFNLVTNARDAMADGGVLALAVKGVWLDADDARSFELPVGDYVAFEVCDDGVGMDEETQARMFEPFFTTKGGSGTGLGMPMVYGLMKQQAGAVVVETAAGVGTTVRLLFPIAQRVSEPPVDDEGADDAIDAKCILLVEDEPAVRGVTLAILTDAGYLVEAVQNGKHALRVLSEDPRRFDVVVCDFVMPEMGGAELYRAAKKLDHAPPFLFVTGSTEEDVLSAIDGPAKVRQKPFRVDELLEALDNV